MTKNRDLMLLSEYVAAEDGEREAYLAAMSEEELLQLGIDLHNAGHYWHAHEAWEAVWLDAPERLRAFYQGLIQLTAAFVHVVRNEYPGAVRLLEAAIAKLKRYPDAYQGVALAELVADAVAAHQRLLDLGERGLPDFDPALIPPIRTTASA
jgi:predicted metal-dependent hydrolase